MCLLTELFFLDMVSLQASHLSLADTTARRSPLNWFNLSQALIFGSAVPRTFRFFSAGFVCTLRFLEAAAFSGVLSLAPASVVTLKGFEGLFRLIHSSMNIPPPSWIFFKKNTDQPSKTNFRFAQEIKSMNYHREIRNQDQFKYSKVKAAPISQNR